MISFSVIIPTCNRYHLLDLCLAPLSPKNQETKNFNYQVIVTDDSKDNLTKNFVKERYPWVEWIAGPMKGPAANRNNGAKKSIYEWLVFIDDDCIPDENILENYKNAIHKFPTEQVFEGMIVPDDWNLLKKDLSECPVNTEGNCFWSANICIRSSLFKHVSGFDEDYLIAAHEDQQLKYDIERLIRHQIVFIKESKVIHPVRVASMISKIRRIPVISRNYALFAVKNRHILHRNSLIVFGIGQLQFHLKSIMEFAKAGKAKSVIVSITYAVYAVPLNIINYMRIVKKYR